MTVGRAAELATLEPNPGLDLAPDGLDRVPRDRRRDRDGDVVRFVRGCRPSVQVGWDLWLAADPCGRPGGRGLEGGGLAGHEHSVGEADFGPGDDFARRVIGRPRPSQRRERVSAIVTAVLFTRAFRVRLIGLLSMVILFSQVTVAAYACPAMDGRSDSMAADMTGMPCATMMAAGIELDPEQPLLCHQHCQFGSASPGVDHLPPVLVSSADLPAMLFVPAFVEQDLAFASRAQSDPRRDRLPPPHSIVHCCFRI